MLDTRTKLFVVISYNILMMFVTPKDEWMYIIIGLWFIPILCLSLYKEVKLAIYFAAGLIIVNMLQYFVIPLLNGALLYIMLGVISITVRILPGFMMFYFFIRTTTVSQFAAAMHRLHIPKGLIISFSVMFRFIPTIMYEYQYIKKSMTLRGLSGISALKYPMKSIEYRLVPLIVSVTSIGNDLTVASMTRGISNPERRTSIYTERIATFDITFIMLMLTIWCYYVRSVIV